MIVLEIKQPGHSLDIPGFAEVKTPVKIDVTKRDLNLILSYLKKNGITNYSIKTINEEESEQKKDDNNLTKKMENIESLLVKLIEQSKSSNKIIYEKVVKEEINKKNEIEEEDNNFIPEINITGLSTKGNINQTTVQSDSKDDIKESANLLKNLKKNSLKNYHG